MPVSSVSQWHSFSLVVAGVIYGQVYLASSCYERSCRAVDELVLLQKNAHMRKDAVVETGVESVQQVTHATGGSHRYDHVLRLASVFGSTGCSNGTASAQCASFLVRRATEFYSNALARVIARPWAPSIYSACVIATVGLGLIFGCCLVHAQERGAAGTSDGTRAAPQLPQLNRKVSFDSAVHTPQEGAPSELQLEMDLPVVDGTEQCVLFVPARVDGDGPTEIEDGTGRTVLRIEPRGPSALQSPHARSVLRSPKSPGAADLWRLLICSAGHDRTILAQCCLVGTTEFHLRHGNGTYFGKLMHAGEADDTYALTTRAGEHYIYKSESSERCFQVINGSDIIVATAEPAESDCGRLVGYQLTAGCRDVSAILCGLLCIDWHRASEPS